MASYTRQSSFSDGDTITAALFNNEYNQLLNAFAYASSSTTGHRHDGTAAEGGNIHTIGDQDFLNKIVADSTNNRWGVFVQVSSSAVEQIRISDGVISPVTDNDIDLGTSSLEFKDLFIDGTAHIDTLDVDVNATVAGTLGVTGALTGSSTIQGTTITATTAFVPDASDGAALGTSALEFSDLFLADGAVINFGDDQDVSLTHVADTGILLSSTDQLQFGDSGTYIHQSADGVLDLVSDTEIELTATTIDINGAINASGEIIAASLDISGNIDIDGTTNLDVVDIDGAVDMATTLQVDGVATFTGRDVHSGGITIANAGQIGSVGDTDAIAIASDGVVTLTQKLIGTELDISGAIDVDGVTNLDVVDIDGAVDMASTLAVAGVVTANAGVVVDNITIDGTTIALSSGDLLLDVAGDIVLDADGTDITFKDGGTTFGKIGQLNNDLYIGTNNTTLSFIDGQRTINPTGTNGAQASDLISLGDANNRFKNLFLSGNLDVDGTANLDVVDIDGAVDMASTLAVAGVLTGASLDISGAIDIDGTSNLDAVDIDGAVQADATITVGVDDTGYDVKFFGATSGSHLLWDESADDLKLVGAAGLTVAGDISSTTAGTSNFRAGVNAGNTIESGGNYNVVVGDEAGTAITTGDNNVFVGYAAGDATTTASGNTAVGQDALTENTTGSENIAIGRSALAVSTTGAQNIAIGSLALDANTTASFNIAIGHSAMTANITGNQNVAIGRNALDTNTTGVSNVALGNHALDANTTANSNTAIGYQALTANTTGASNTAVGRGALDANTTANDNVAIGLDALGANTTGANNTAVGRDALKANTTAGSNTAVGDRCLDVNTTGADNTGVGKGALGANTEGANNTAVGKNAGVAVTTGVTNTLIGSLCHDNLTEGNLNTALGYNLAPSAVDVDSEIVIGSSITGAGTNTVRIGTGGGTATLGLDGSDTSWAAASDSRLKKDVADSTAGLEFINDLRPITFKWNAKNEVAENLPQHDADSSDPIFGEGKAHHGFIAQEVKSVIDDHSDVLDGNNIWHEDPDGTQQLSQGNLVPMLVKAVQELSAKIAELESKPQCKCNGE